MWFYSKLWTNVFFSYIIQKHLLSIFLFHEMGRFYGSIQGKNPDLQLGIMSNPRVSQDRNSTSLKALNSWISRRYRLVAKVNTRVIFLFSIQMHTELRRYPLTDEATQTYKLMCYVSKVLFGFVIMLHLIPCRKWSSFVILQCNGIRKQHRFIFHSLGHVAL